MKHSRLYFPLALLFLFLLSSCSDLGKLTVAKRHYGKGYYVHLSGKPSTEPAIAAEEPAPATTAEAAPAADQPEQATAPAPVASTAPAASEPASVRTEQTAAAASTQQQVQPQVKQKPLQRLQKLVQPAKPAAGGDVDTVILVILAIFLSPLAVFLKQGASKYFWIDLICWLLGGGFFFSPFFYGGGLLLFAIIFALLIVLDVI